MTGHHHRPDKTEKPSRKGLSKGPWALLCGALPAVGFGASALLLTWIGGAGHHFIGLAVALVLLVIPLGFMKGTMDGLRIDEAEVDAPVPFVSFWSTINFSLTAVLVLLCIFAELSFALVSWQLASFSPSERLASYPAMLATYAWFLIDLMPFTDPVHTFGMKEPRLQPHGWIAGAPILAFQTIIVIYLLEVCRRAWSLYQRQSTQQFLERLGVAKRQSDRYSSKADSEQ